jgi:uncharacterized protein YhdP
MTLKGFSKGGGGGVGSSAVLGQMSAYSNVKKLGIGTAQSFLGGTSTYAISSRLTLSNGDTLISRNVTIATNRVTVTVDGLYNIKFNATIQHSGGTATRFQMYIGRETGGQAADFISRTDTSQNSSFAVTDMMDWTGPLLAGDIIDFKVGSNTAGINCTTQAFSVSIIPVDIPV